MNFKPNKLKVIICIILLIIISISLAFLILDGNSLSDCEFFLNRPTRAGWGLMIKICQNQPAFFFGVFLVGLIIAGLFYVIWSLIQRKKVE